MGAVAWAVQISAPLFLFLLTSCAQPTAQLGARPAVAPEACDKPSCEAVIGNWTGTGDGKTPVFSYGASRGETGLLHLQWSSSSPLSLRVYNTQSPIPPVPVFSGTQPNGEASINTAPGNYYTVVNTNGSWTVTASQSVANKQFVELQMSAQATATTVSEPASNATCFTGPGLPLCVPADQIWYKSATEWYNPSTYCKWGREQLPERLQKVCRELDQKHPQPPSYTRTASAQSRPFGGLRWKDGYIDGGRFVKAEWRTIEADNGAVTAVDMKSLVRNDLNHSAYVVAYVVEGDFFDPGNLRGFQFDCQGHFTILSAAGMSPLAYAPPRSVAAQIAALACAPAR